MSNNLKVVNYFVKHFYCIGELDVSYIASPRFTFVVDDGPAMGFKEYEERKNRLLKNARVSCSEFLTDDNCMFWARFEVDANLKEKQTGICKMIVEEGLLTSVHLNFNNSPDIMVEYEHLMSGGDRAAEVYHLD